MPHRRCLRRTERKGSELFLRPATKNSRMIVVFRFIHIVDRYLMARWLFKSEPDCYSFADLRRDGSTLWDGVTNALARKHLRTVRRGDEILFYHTGDEK